MGLLCSINTLRRLTPQEAVSINAAISSSVYPATMQEELQGAVDSIVEVTATEKDANKDRQKIKQIWNYPTPSEWSTILNDKKSFTAKASCLTHRLMLIGCHSPDEQSLKWVLAVLLMVCYQDLPYAQIRHDKLLELKAIVACEKKVFQQLLGTSAPLGCFSLGPITPGSDYLHLFDTYSRMELHIKGLGITKEMQAQGFACCARIYSLRKSEW